MRILMTEQRREMDEALAETCFPLVTARPFVPELRRESTSSQFRCSVKPTDLSVLGACRPIVLPMSRRRFLRFFCRPDAGSALIFRVRLVFRAQSDQEEDHCLLLANPAALD